MKKGSKAQANIITTVLIILIILVALIILWNLVLGIIKKSGSQVGVEQFALTGSTKYTLSGAKDNINVSITRNAGNANVSGVKIIFKFSDGSSRVYENRANIPAELETRFYNIKASYLSPGVTDFSNLSLVSFAFIIKDLNGKESITREIASADEPSAGVSGGSGTITPPSTCTLDSQCNDGNVCTTDTCTNPGPSGTCSNTPNTVSCNDGNLCTTGETCSAGVCTGGSGCSGGTTCCSSGCVNTQTDNNNCGTCGTVCSGGTPNCINGVCSAIANCLNALLNPVPICTCNDLQNMGLNLNLNYALMNNIDCSETITWNSGKGFKPIGNLSDPANTVFQGNLLGNNYNIINLYINRPDEDYVGLIGDIGYDSPLIIPNTQIKDVHLINVNINGGNFTGALLGNGYFGNSNLIINCSSTGNVKGYDYVGGLFGSLGFANVYNSYSTANVNGHDYVGGFISSDYPTSYFYNSYATGNINGNEIVGGFIGSLGGLINNSYATGNVNGSNSVGGFAGENQVNIYNSFSTGNVNGSDIVGGFVGNNFGTLENCYWNKKNTNPVNCYDGGNTGCTAIQNNQAYFYSPSNPPMTSWDFTKIWKDNSGGNNYPTLKWQG